MIFRTPLTVLFRPFAALFLFITWTSVGHSQTDINTVCRIQNVQDVEVQGRALKVQFPDGRWVVVVGHMHGARQIYDLAVKVETDAIQLLSNKDFVALLKQIESENSKTYTGLLTQENRTREVQKIFDETGVDTSLILRPQSGLPLTGISVVAHAEQDRKFLKKELSSSSPPQFVGFEGTHAAWEENYPYFRKTTNEIIRQYQVRGLSKQFSQSQVEGILRSAMGANSYAFVEQPALTQSVAMYGTEGEEPVEGEDLLQNMANAWQAIVDADTAHWATQNKRDLEKFKSNSKNAGKLALLQFVFWEVHNMNIISEKQLSQYIDEIQRAAFPWIRQEVRALSRAFQERVKKSFSRDLTSAQNLALRQQSGIHFVGLNHLRNTVANLAALCKKEQESESYKSSSESNK